MSNIQDFEKKVSSIKPNLINGYGVRQIGFFGSRIRGDQNESSDLDVLIDFMEPISLFKFIELENHLSRELGIKVDLVMKDSLKPAIGEQILKEVIYV